MSFLLVHFTSIRCPFLHHRRLLFFVLSMILVCTKKCVSFQSYHQLPHVVVAGASSHNNKHLHTTKVPSPSSLRRLDTATSKSIINSCKEQRFCYCQFGLCLSTSASTSAPLSSDCGGEDPIATTTTTTTNSRISNIGQQRLTWTDHVRELIKYKEEHGDTLVPKRYSANPSLGLWVSKQRMNYKKYIANENCSLTDGKIQLLDKIGFSWNGMAKIDEYSKRRWWENLEDFKQHMYLSEKQLPPSLERWIAIQRIEYKRKLEGHDDNKLDEGKIAALNEIDPEWWKSKRQRNWEIRCRELVEYRNEYGNCCVPISYKNKRLAHWVSNLRKKYNLRLAGKTTTLYNDQIEELNKLGFVWDRWEYEFFFNKTSTNTTRMLNNN